MLLMSVSLNLALEEDVDLEEVIPDVVADGVVHGGGVGACVGLGLEEHLRRDGHVVVGDAERPHQLGPVVLRRPQC